MDYWEFLLQQEGDNSWLPLESSQVEILEGRYRVMAHTSQLNQPVQVRISQLLLGYSPPKRRSLKRASQTRENGLMVVMPFTWLTAGLWEIDCAQMVADDDGEEPSWRYRVQLRVLPQESGDDGGWFADDGGMATLDEPPSPGQSYISNSDDLAAPAPAVEAQDARSLAPPVLEQILRLAAAAARAAGQGLTPSSSAVAWQLQLAQSAFVGSKGQTLTIAGQVTAAATDAYPGGYLVLQLADPQNGQPVLVSQKAMGAGATPLSFALDVSIPHQLETRLLLGEAILAQVAGETVSLQALERFTITIDLADLFDVIANQAEAQPDFDVVFPAELGEAAEGSLRETPAGSPSHPLVPPLAPPPRAIPAVTLPKDGSQLPPRIYYPSPHEAAARQPALPPLVDRDRPSPGRSPAEGPPGAPPADPAPPAAPSAPAVKLPSFKKSPSPGAEVEPSAGDAASLSAPTLAQKGSQKAKGPPALPSHEEAAFRSLNLQDRFWTRLNALAADIQQSVQQQTDADTPNQTLADPWESAQEDDLEASASTTFPGEVVIYDDQDTTVGSASLATDPVSPPATEADGTTEIVSPPAPEIEVPDGELTAGDAVMLNLRVPFHANRLYLKIWMTDPQTRTLADEPRQLMHLSPDGSGHMIGTIQLTVPLGCLEVWFEAIAVDMITQQESYKAVVARPVKPADLPETSLEDFDL